MQPPPDIPDHELIRLIGRGAYGEVWLARNVMGLMRAVKVVRRAAFESSRPFEREFAAVKRYEPVSRTAAGLVNLLHAGQAADGSHFHYVMELADPVEPGIDPATEPEKYAPCTLRVQMGRLGPMAVSDCQEIAVNLAQGIANLHRVGLVHRDVKPSNIIFINGRAKLADIGLVDHISEGKSYVGTEGYVPPEGPGQPGADLYGLGRVLYEMLTGFEASRFPSLPDGWALRGEKGAFEFFEIVLRCCEPDASRRYATADELLADLALLQSGQSVRQVRQLRHRIRLLRKIAAAAVITGALAAAVAWWQGRRADELRHLVLRAEKAEAESRRNLFAGLVQQARNARRSGEADARFTALDLLEAAAALNPGDAVMREEFISTLATPGLKLTATHPAGTVLPGFATTPALAWREDGTVSVLDPAGNATPQVWKTALPFRTGIDVAPVLSADSTVAAFGEGGGTRLHLHALPGGKLLHQLTSPRALHGSVALSADGTVVAAGFLDGGIGIWRTTGTGVCEVIETGNDAVCAVALTPDGRFLVTNTWSALSHLWDLADGTRLTRVPLPGGTPTFSADGRRLLLRTANASRFFQFDPADLCRSLVLPRQKISSRDGAFDRFTLHPTAPLLAVPGPDGVRVFHTTTGALLRTWPTPTIDAQFSADGRHLVLAGLTCISLPVQENPGPAWTFGNPEPLGMNTPGQLYYQVRTVPDATLAAAFSTDGTWHLMQRSPDGPHTRRFPMEPNASEFCSLSPDGHLLVHGFRQSSLRLLDTTDGHTIRDIPATGDWTSCAFSPDGHLLALGDALGFRALDTTTWDQAWHQPAGANGSIGRPLWFAPSSHWLLTATQPGSLTLHHARTGHPAVTLHRDRDDSLRHLALDAQGTQLWNLDHRSQTLWRWDLEKLRHFLKERRLDWREE